MENLILDPKTPEKNLFLIFFYLKKSDSVTF